MIQNLGRFRAELILAAIVALGAAIYLIATLAMYDHLAFPLDDSWIHLVIARNIAQHGEFAYNAGEPTNGSTAPLWTLLLSLGYLFGVEFRVWSYGLGLFFAWAFGVVLYRLGAAYLIRDRRVALVAAGLALLEWHVLWCGLAAMETTLFIFLSLYLLYCHLRGVGALAVGGLGALLVLTRPEGLALLGLVALDGVVRQRGWGRRVRYTLAFALPFALLIGPLILYNLGVSGQPLPATFYAKTVEFVDPAGRTLFGVIGNWLLLVFWSIVLGPQLLLLPGIVYGVTRIIRDLLARTHEARRRFGLLLLGWWALLLSAYAFQLPLMSHHGRYYVPLFPLLILLGVWGLWELDKIYRRFRLLKRVYVLLTALAFTVLWLNGALVYAKDVRLIDDEWIPLSTWLRDHTPPDALVAAHDIGALGYFSQRRIIDMAGLVTPGAIPYIGDQEGMRAYLAAQGVDYVVTFPLWYPEMIRDPALELVYQGSSPYLRASFEHNLQVYKAHWGE